MVVNLDRFPILRDSSGGGIICSIPWVMIAPHEAQASLNHGGQSLYRLAERGGLSACEVVAVLEDRAYTKMTITEAETRLRQIATAYYART